MIIKVSNTNTLHTFDTDDIEYYEKRITTTQKTGLSEDTKVENYHVYLLMKNNQFETTLKGECLALLREKAPSKEKKGRADEN